GGWEGLESRTLAFSELTLVCSPQFLRDNPLSAASDLESSLLIQETAKECWDTWLAAAGVAGQVVPSGPTLNGDLVIAAAEAGQGFALADQIQAGDALIAGRLVRPLDIRATRFGYYLVRRLGAKMSDASQAFAAWLETELKAFTAHLSKARVAPVSRKTGKSQSRPQSRSANVS
ncbi:MAG TPA: LysR substrate-binding domain-containing protein, partial [Hyphomicrobium sp.]|nr:LysR substrate-binding domain-containing protein [Hyphomicrobium sp.]